MSFRTGSVAYADQKIQEQAKIAAEFAAKKAARAASGSDQPLVLYFYDGLEIIMRPLADLNAAIIAFKHYKWSSVKGETIEAICAREIDQPCALCEQAKEDKQLTARESWFIPVYMHQALKTKDKDSIPLPDPELVVYKEDDQTKQARGYRVLEMKDYGADATILKTIRKYMSNPENGSLTDYDIEVGQAGKGKGNKSFVIERKNPRPRPDILAKAPTLERVWERLLEKLPPVVTAAAHAEQVYNDTGKNIVIPMDEASDVNDEF